MSGKNWDYFNNLSPEDGFSEFTSHINKSLDKFTPERCISIPAKYIINEPWMTPGLMTSSKKCGKLFSKIIGNDKASPGYLKYIAYRNKLNSIKRKAKFAFYHNKINMFGNNSSKLWKLIKQIIGKQNNKTSITDTFIINNLPNTNPTTISNSFCEYFSTIGNQLAANIHKSKKFPHAFTQGEYSDSFFMAPTDQNEIQKIIMKLKQKKSAGHDKLNSIMYKKLAEVLSHPISLLINKYLSTGIVPDSMKLAKVIPIYKSKNSKLFSNYRPISQLPTLSKLLEKVVHRRVYQFLKNTKILYSSQYGLRPGHSTEFLWNTLRNIIIKP